MKYAISNWIYGDEQLETTITRLREFGYDGIELKADPELYSPQEVKRLCEDSGLDVLSLAGIFPWPTTSRDLSAQDKEVRTRAVEYVRRCCDLAVAVGAPLIIVVPSAVGKTAPEGNPKKEEDWVHGWERAWQNAVESVSEAAAYAEGCQVDLAIEPINRYESFLINSVEQALAFASQVGSAAVKIHLDSFQF